MTAPLPIAHSYNLARLGNAGDQVTMVFFSLFPIGVPSIMLLLHVLVSFVQAFLFMLLSMIYLGQAVAHEH